MIDNTIHKGGCHCGAVSFEVHAPADMEALRCNCSICTMTGFVHLIVPKDAFELISGQDQLTDYRFNTGTAKHLFCRTCGVKSFYIPRSHPDGVSVNVNCLDQRNVKSITYADFDGQNWEEAISDLNP